MKIKLYQDDLPNNLNLGLTIAIDTETMGLNPIRDKLCLVQISKGNNISHLVKINDIKKKPKNLIKILKNNKIKKIFHFARFDVAVLKHSYGINLKNIYCTKIASKIIRTYTDKHGYKDLCSELLNISISKTEQTSDWGGELSKAQMKYADKRNSPAAILYGENDILSLEEHCVAYSTPEKILFLHNVSVFYEIFYFLFNLIIVFSSF